MGMTKLLVFTIVFVGQDAFSISLKDIKPSAAHERPGLFIPGKSASGAKPAVYTMSNNGNGAKLVVHTDEGESLVKYMQNGLNDKIGKSTLVDASLLKVQRKNGTGYELFTAEKFQFERIESINMLDKKKVAYEAEIKRFDRLVDEHGTGQVAVDPKFGHKHFAMSVFREGKWVRDARVELDRDNARSATIILKEDPGHQAALGIHPFEGERRLPLDLPREFSGALESVTVHPNGIDVYVRTTAGQDLHFQKVSPSVHTLVEKVELRLVKEEKQPLSGLAERKRKFGANSTSMMKLEYGDVAANGGRGARERLILQ